MIPVVIQILMKRKKQQALASSPASQPDDAPNEKTLYYKDVAGFFIFLLVVFTVLMISLYA